ncbi:hypothetical protein C2845_PM05G27430 [Panicum miliaceum]|uniref:Uncharacterized protein n=1 Tax=Panicum miliaceum TaxID=4540 RepID=A0A3L6SUU7_PANMI|nr:hypothetical protein C2845_PM05G27430 [Panicum miliaceum]
MEVRQFKRYAEGHADREHEVREELALLSDLAASYHTFLQSHGIDPNSFTDVEEELGEEGDEAEQFDMDEAESGRSTAGWGKRRLTRGGRRIFFRLGAHPRGADIAPDGVVYGTAEKLDVKLGTVGGGFFRLFPK